MVTVPAFRDGATALRSSPGLLVAGLLVALASQLQTVGELIESPLLATGVSLAWLFVFPFVIGGFIGVARAAIDGDDPSLGEFVAAGRTHYARMLLGTILFTLIVVGAALGLGLLGFAIGVGVLAISAIGDPAAFAVAVGSTVLWLLPVFAVVVLVQFYDAAIVIEGEGAADAVHRSVAVVRANLASVVGFSVLWTLLLNAVMLPDYLVRALVTDAEVVDVLPIDPGVPVALLVPVAVAVSAIGFAYFYAVYTAYYVRLVSPESPDSAPA